ARSRSRHAPKAAPIRRVVPRSAGPGSKLAAAASRRRRRSATKNAIRMSHAAASGPSSFLAPALHDRHVVAVAPFLPRAVVGPHVVVPEGCKHQMRESRADPELAVRDRRGLRAETGVDVHLLELARVLQGPVIPERVLPEDVDRTRDVSPVLRASLLAR